MDFQTARNIILTTVDNKAEKALSAYLQAEANRLICDRLALMETLGWIDSSTAARLVFQLSANPVRPPGEVPGPAIAVGLAVPSPRLPGAVPVGAGPESSQGATRASSKPPKPRPRTKPKPGPSANGVRRCPICGIPISHQAVGCRAHWRQVRARARQRARAVAGAARVGDPPDTVVWSEDGAHELEGVT